jgi:hypothetical protein
MTRRDVGPVRRLLLWVPILVVVAFLAMLLLMPSGK